MIIRNVVCTGTVASGELSRRGGRVVGLQPVIGAFQPSAMLRVMDESERPNLVDDGPVISRVVTVRIDDALHRAPCGHANVPSTGRHSAAPSQISIPSGRHYFVIARINRLDVPRKQ